MHYLKLGLLTGLLLSTTLSASCIPKNYKLPKGAQILATGGYSPVKLDGKIDEKSGVNASKMDVKVHWSKPVFLVMSSKEPTVWNVSWSKKTKVVGAFVSGLHHQEVIGLPKGTPIFISTAEKDTGCGSFYFHLDQLDHMDAVIHKALGQKIDNAFVNNTKGMALLGEAVEKEKYSNSSWRTLKSVLKKPKPIKAKKK